MTADLTIRFGPLALALSGRHLGVVPAPAGERTYTDGATLYLSAGPDGDPAVEIAVQCALLAAGSLEPRPMRHLLGRPEQARRYLALEAGRAIRLAPPLLRLVIGDRVVLPSLATANTEASLRMSADRRLTVPDEPLLGVLRPARLLAAAGPLARGVARPEDFRRKPQVPPDETPVLDDDETADALPGFLRKLSSAISLLNPFAKAFNQVMGSRRAPGADGPGMEIPTVSARRAMSRSPDSRAPVYALEMEGTDAAGHLVSRWVYPEWDCLRGAYRPDWCAVHEVPFDRIADRAAERPFQRDTHLEAALRRLALRMGRERRQRDGDDIDLDAAVEFVVEFAVRGRSSATAGGERPAIYTANRRTRRDLAALVMIDVSGSVAEQAGARQSIHGEQMQAAAALTHALGAVGDYVSACAFHSYGRDAARVITLKPFGATTTHAAVKHILALKPSGYTRLGVGIRHGVHRLIHDSGVERRLLVVVSDGVPYDTGYSGRYACQDVIRALAEAAAQKIHVLWICFGRMAPELDAAAGTWTLVKAPSYDALRLVLPRAIARCLGRRGSGLK